MEGRWTILTGQNGDYHGFQTETGNRILAGGIRMDTRPVPVMPCDDAAIERAVEAVNVAHESKIDSTWRELLEVAFRAAGNTP